MNSIRSFLAGIVDYAGLFPPAALGMEAAVRNYAEYRNGDDCDLLGRFVVPAARLDEFRDVSRRLLDHSERSAPWRLSGIAGDDVIAARKAILEFNCAPAPGNGSDSSPAVCDAVELHARTEADIAEGVRAFPGSFRLFFEIAVDTHPEPLLDAVARHSASAKIRTGGVTEAAFPFASRIIQFIGVCSRLGVPFKATAGLHHALRSSYPLTYDAGSQSAMMFGYVNLFLAAAFIHTGMDEPLAREVLEEQSADAFLFSKDGVSWHGHNLGLPDLAATRAQLALSFGSCSFREPVDEARALHLL